MPQPPSRKDVTGPPPRDNSDLRFPARRHESYLRSLDPGYLGGRFATPSPVHNQPSQIVGDDGGDAAEPDSVQFINTDQFVIDGPGDKVFELSYIPIQDGATSLHVYWVPLYVPTNNWTCEDNVLRVTDPGWRADDLVEVAYAYEYDGEPEPSDVVSDFAASGWKWLQVPFHDAGDYSDPLFDDSAWAGGVGPFGETTPPHSVSTTFSPRAWPDYATVWNQSTQMWARRGVTLEPGVDVTISTRLNRTLNLWWNGNYRGQTTADEHVWTVPASLVLATNVVVFKAKDEGFTGPYTGCYFDVQISQTLEEA